LVSGASARIAVLGGWLKGAMPIGPDREMIGRKALKPRLGGRMQTINCRDRRAAHGSNADHQT